MLYALLTLGEGGDPESSFEFTKMKECFYKIYEKVNQTA